MALTKTSWEIGPATWLILGFVTLLSYVSVSAVEDRFLILTGMPGYRPLSFAFTVYVFIL